MDSRAHLFSLSGAYESRIIRITLPLLTVPISQTCVSYPPYGWRLRSQSYRDARLYSPRRQNTSGSRRTPRLLTEGQFRRLRRCFLLIPPSLPSSHSCAVCSANCVRVRPALCPGAFRTRSNRSKHRLPTPLPMPPTMAAR